MSSRDVGGRGPVEACQWFAVQLSGCVQRHITSNSANLAPPAAIPLQKSQPLCTASFSCLPPQLKAYHKLPANVDVCPGSYDAIQHELHLHHSLSGAGWKLQLCCRAGGEFLTKLPSPASLAALCGVALCFEYICLISTTRLLTPAESNRNGLCRQRNVSL